MAALITVGLPVRNAEGLIGDAIGSVLDQDVGDLRLVIADNASTDGTARVCREFTEMDSRVCYFRHETNIGMIPNFRWLAANAEGDYFKWLSADDRMLRGFLSTCIRGLEDDQSAVVAMTGLADIDLSARSPAPVVVDEDLSLAVESAPARFRGLMHQHQCLPQFGVFRLATLRQVRPYSWVGEGDRVLLAEMALRGRIISLPEVLYHRGIHPQRSMNVTSSAERLAIMYPPMAGKIPMPAWRLAWELASVVYEAPLSFQEKTECWLSMRIWFADNWEKMGRNLVRAAVEHLQRHPVLRSRGGASGSTRAGTRPHESVREPFGA
jgi:hypothetical protein